MTATITRGEVEQEHFVSQIARLAGKGVLGNTALVPDGVEADDDFSIIMFEIGSSIFALPTMSVLEVVQVTEIVAIPRAPAFIEGVIEIRDQVIPVVDLRKRLGSIAKNSGESIIIVTLIAGTKTGFIVDAARKVISLAVDEMQDLGSMLSGPERRYVYRTISRNNEPVVILNVDTLLKDEEISSLADVGGIPS